MSEKKRKEKTIPDKKYFRIGEVVDLVGVRSHVLRYWEREISTICPAKSASNQRRYHRKDVELFMELKRLLRDERYTLAGAKQRLEEIKVSEGMRVKAERGSTCHTEELKVTSEAVEHVVKIRTGLKELIALCEYTP
jgi:DNA-binding transcriptional MerR regulator